MKVTVCELPNCATYSDNEWNSLIDDVKVENTDFLLLPEMPFYGWLAGSKEVKPELWQEAVEAHDKWLARLAEIPAGIIVGSRPVIRDGRRHNEGFVREKEFGYHKVHTKHYLPNEEGFWEATWYERGEREFKVCEVQGVKVGFMICTDLWFTAHAREYAKQGAHLIVCPRATPIGSVNTWLAGGQAAAVVAGAYCLSSNFNGPHPAGYEFGGTGWIAEPDGGKVLGVTTKEKPFLTLDIDLAEAEKAKQTYPRYVLD
jgi:N-carbamoylputrescine amidase